MSKAIEQATTATPHQLSFGEFEELVEKGLSIREARNDIGFKRSQVFRAISDLNVSDLKFLDVAYFLGAQNPDHIGPYYTELSYFKWLMRYTSRNHNHFLSIITRLQKVLIQVASVPLDGEISEKDDWLSTQLIGTAGIKNQQIYFDIPPLLRLHLKNPGNSPQWMSLRITSSFTRTYARAIYDRLLDYRELGITDWIPINDVRLWPGKTDETWAASTEFKNFKRSYLDPAINQINEVSDISVTYTLKRGSTRKVEFIKFEIIQQRTADKFQEFKCAQDLYEILHNEFGFSTSEFNLLTEHRLEWSDERIYAAIDYTRYQIKRGGVKNASAYLMGAIKKALRLGEAQIEIDLINLKKDQAKTEVENQLTTIQHSLLNERSAEQENLISKKEQDANAGRTAFVAMMAKEKKSMISGFKASTLATLAFKRAKVKKTEVNEDLLTTDDRFSTDFFVYVFEQMKNLAA